MVPHAADKSYYIIFRTDFIFTKSSYFYLLIMDSYIILKNIRFFAQHGVAPQERLVGNEFILNLKLKVDVSLAIETDEVSHTVSYADVHQSVKKKWKFPHAC